MGAVDTVELEVRELVRRRGIDPFADQVQVRRLVDEVVADYDERSLTSALPQLVNVGQAARSVYDAVAGFGPLQRHLDDPTVEEVWINERPSGVSTEGGSMARLSGPWKASRRSRRARGGGLRAAGRPDPADDGRVHRHVPRVRSVPLRGELGQSGEDVGVTASGSAER